MLEVNVFLFLSLSFLFTMIVGKQIERLRVPWIFAALLLGAILAIRNPFTQITNSPTFIFLANLGMYFLLFLIGFELDIQEMRSKSGFFLKATAFIELFEAFFGTLLLHFIFHASWTVSFLVALSFATVGEAILIPILDEFKIVNTRLGQAIIGIGTLDDIIEIVTLFFAAILIGSKKAQLDVSSLALSLLLLCALTFAFIALKKQVKRFESFKLELTFFFMLSTLFLFLGVGQFADLTSLGALLAGIVFKQFVRQSKLAIIEKELKSICYGFFAPIFFIWVGATLDMHYLFTYPLLVILVVAVANGAKMVASYLFARKELGVKQSILLGIGLSVRFSTSIVIITLLYHNGIIGSDIYSVIVASSIVFKFIIPVLFSNLLVRWKLTPVRN